MMTKLLIIALGMLCSELNRESGAAVQGKTCLTTRGTAQNVRELAMRFKGLALSGVVRKGMTEEEVFAILGPKNAGICEDRGASLTYVYPDLWLAVTCSATTGVGGRIQRRVTNVFFLGEGEKRCQEPFFRKGS